MKKISPFLLLLFFLNHTFGQAPLTQFGSDVFVSNNPNQDITSAISGDGLTTIIGSSLYPNGEGVGLAKVFKYISGNWQQLGGDINGEVSGEEFGSEVSISDDGLTIAIGACKKTTSLGWGTGYVKIFSLVAGNWVQKGTSLYGQLVNSAFGRDICLSGDGNTIAIASNTISVFNYTSGSWMQIGNNTLYPSPASIDVTRFDMSSNGTRIAIGGFIYDLISNEWTRTDNNFLYGSGVSARHMSLSGDGNTIIVGGDFSFFIYKNYGGGNWQYSYGENVSTIGNGMYVSISFDGNSVSVYDYYQSTVRMYRFTNNAWEYFANIQPFQGFYGGVDLSADGSKVSTLSFLNIAEPFGYVRTLKVYDVAPFLETQTFENANFTVYPNPAKNEINIKIDANSAFKKVVLYNLYGQKIYESNTPSFDISSYSKGCYLLEVITDKTSEVKRVIFQ